MPVQKIDCQVDLAASPAAVWDLVGHFVDDWHPSVAWCRPDHQDGRILRRFALHDDDTEYLEQLTYYSASDFTFRYRCLQGISGIDTYDGHCWLTEIDAGQTRVHWQARVSAPSPRLQVVVAASQSLLQQGLDHLVGLCFTDTVESELTDVEICPARVEQLRRTPKLSYRYLAGPNGMDDWLCLFLHGIGGQADNWSSQVSLAARYMPAAALDLRGYGKSELGTEPTRVDDYCNDIQTVCRHIGARYLVLVGLSYGSWIATYYALHHGSHLVGLVVSGGCTGMSEATLDERDAFLKVRQQPLDEGRIPADFAPIVVEKISGPEATSEQRQQLLSSMAAISAATYGDALACFCQPPDVFDFSRLACPVLLMTGEHDRLAPPEELRQVSQRMVHSVNGAVDVRFEVIKGAGHVVNVEQPARFNTALGEFLTRLSIRCATETAQHVTT